MKPKMKILSEVKDKLKGKAVKVEKEDPYVTLLGHIGNWQIFVFVTISMVKLDFGWVQLAILFLTPNLTFWCVNLPNSNIEVKNNTCYKGCLKYAYDTRPFGNTIVSEWDLICERRWLASFTQTMMQFGALCGSIIFGYESDRYGRKNTFLVSVTIVIVIGLIIPFSTSYVMFTSLRTIHGGAIAGSAIIAFVIIMESVGPKYREVLGCLYHIPTIIGHATLSPIAYYNRDWDRYMLTLGLPCVVYIGYYCTVSESPRWLVSHGRVNEAIKVVTRAARINKLPTTKIDGTLRLMSQESSASTPKLNYSALFRKSLVIKTLSCCFMWLIDGMIFYGFNQYLSQTSPDPFISVALAGLMQIPSNILSIWLIKKYGRRLTITVFFMLCGFFIIVLELLPEVLAATLTFGTLGVSCSAIVAIAIYVYTSELFPTVVRNMGFGASSMAMRIGSMVAPFVSNTADDVPWLSTAIFGGSALIAGAVCLILPETKGSNLTDTIE